jgi:hypothetical protein
LIRRYGMKTGNRNVRNALMQARLDIVLLLTGVFFITGCSEDSISPEFSVVDQIPDMCVSYYDNLNGDLKYTTRSGDFWGEPIVLSCVYDIGQWPSLALDTEGFAHIGYYDAQHGTLKYTNEDRCGCEWSVETIDFVGNSGSYTSLAVDADGNPHISYYDEAGGSLKHAEKKNGTWIIEVVDNAGSVGKFTSLALDIRGNPHISYFDNTNADLKYASRVGGYWIIETVDSDGSVGWHTSLTLDAHGDPHICYCEQDYVPTLEGHTLVGTLKYAIINEGRWECTLIDRENGQFPSLILDAQGNPHISYYMCDIDISGYLGIPATISLSYVPKYAVGIDGFWIKETIGQDHINVEMPFFQDVTLCTSIALDDRGSPYISFYEWGGGDLKCAMKVGSRWIIGTIDEESDVGLFSSLASYHR